MPTLLIAEDSNEDFAVLTHILRKQGFTETIQRCRKGEEILALLQPHDETYKKPVLPSLILLDLNLIGLDGRSVLAEIKHDEALKSIPVVVLTSSSNPCDVCFCYQQGVNSYMVKPIGFEKLVAVVQAFMQYWLHTALLPDMVEWSNSEQYFQNISKS